MIPADQSRRTVGVPDPSDPHGNDPRFVEYYSAASASERSYERAIGTMQAVLRARRLASLPVNALKVADIGCNAGAQSSCWLEHGHTVCGLDVSNDLVEIARKRHLGFGDRAHFEVGTAESLPWPSGAFDVCLLPELLEHVRDWEACLREAVRVLKPGGSLYLSTTNVLCPVQQEFNLPGYSWYPGVLKRYFLQRATSTSPELVNFATYPAYHWFSPYALKRFLEPLGLTVRDRFDLIDVSRKGPGARYAVMLARSIAPLRFLGHVLTPSTTLVAHKAD